MNQFKRVQIVQYRIREAEIAAETLAHAPLCHQVAVMPEDVQEAGAAQVGDGDQPETVPGKRQRKSVDFFAPAAIHTTEKLTVQQVGVFTAGYRSPNHVLQRIVPT